jgi:hypothetical protein
MTRVLLLLLLASVACSNAGELADGIIALDVRPPRPGTVDFGDTARFIVVPLDENGDSVAADVVWRTPDDSVITIIDSALGLVVGDRPDVGGRVQAALGDYRTGLDSIKFQARADTLINLGPAADTVLVDETTSDSLTARLESFNPVGLLNGRPLIFSVIEPIFSDTSLRTVVLPNGGLVDTVTTGAGGTPTPIVTLSRRAGFTAPDSAIVEVRSFRVRGTPVPGSGQRYVVYFQ